MFVVIAIDRPMDAQTSSSKIKNVVVVIVSVVVAVVVVAVVVEVAITGTISCGQNRTYQLLLDMLYCIR